MDATQTEVRFGEGRPESEISHPIIEQAKEAFDAAMPEKSVYDTHREAFQKIVSQIPEDQRGSWNVKIADFWNKVVGRIDDVSARMIDAVQDTVSLGYRAVGKLRGVEVPTGQFENMRKAKIRGAAEAQSEKMKQYIDTQKAFKELIPGGKVLNITDRIFDPRFQRV